MNTAILKGNCFLPINVQSLKHVSSALLKVVLTFGLIFNISFVVLPALTTGRLALLVMFVLYGKTACKQLVEFVQAYRPVLAVFLFLLPFSMIWFVINGTEDSVMFSRAFWFLVFVILAAFLYARMCKLQLFQAMLYYLIAMLVQSLFVLKSVFDVAFRSWVERILIMSGNIDFSEGVRFAGFSNSGGSTLSLQIALGGIASIVLLLQTRNPLGKIALLFANIILLTAVIFVGRIGLYVYFFVGLGFVFFSGRSLYVPVLLVVFIWLASSFVASLTLLGSWIDTDYSKLSRTILWSFDIILTGRSDSTVEFLSALSKIQPLSVLDLLVGTGRITNSDGSNYCGHDSGYFHMLYAVGLPLTVSFYVSLFWMYWRLLLPIRGKLKFFGTCLVFLVFILELKEPFIFKYTLPFFVFVFIYLARLSFTGKRF